MNKFSKIVRKYRNEQQLSLRKFAAQISENLQKGISHQTIKDWEDGKYPGHVYFFLMVAMRYQDWRRDFAFECLYEIYPDFDQYAGENGIDVLSEFYEKEK